MRSVILISGMFLINNLHAQLCDSTFFQDDFSNPANWIIENSGGTAFNNGRCEISAYCGVTNQVNQYLGAVLPDDYWKAEVDVHLLGLNDPGNGTGGYAIALNAGSDDFMAEEQNSVYTETTQDGLAVVMNGSTYDENIANWIFLMEDKKGNVRNFDLSTAISLVSGQMDYYLTFERTSQSELKLSVYSDQARTQHIAGSPQTYNIDPTITGLSYIQHGASTPGFQTRYFNVGFDNDQICVGSRTNELKEIQENQISVLIVPHPVSSEFDLVLGDGIKPLELDLYDVSGKLIAKLKPNDGSMNRFVFPESTGSGIYFGRVKTTDNQQVLVKIQKL